MVSNRYDEMPKVIEYSGQDFDKMLDAIIENHGYSLDEEDEQMTNAQKLHHLYKNNGDGCDFILSIIYENEVIFSGAFSDEFPNKFQVLVDKVAI